MSRTMHAPGRLLLALLLFLSCGTAHAYSVAYFPEGDYVFSVWRDAFNARGEPLHVLTTFSAGADADSGTVRCLYFTGAMPTGIWPESGPFVLQSPGSLRRTGETVTYAHPAPPLPVRAVGEDADGFFDDANRILWLPDADGKQTRFSIAWYPAAEAAVRDRITEWGVTRGCVEGAGGR